MKRVICWFKGHDWLDGEMTDYIGTIGYSPTIVVRCRRCGLQDENKSAEAFRCYLENITTGRDNVAIGKAALREKPSIMDIDSDVAD